MGAGTAPVTDLGPVAEKTVIGTGGARRIETGVGSLLAGVALGAGTGVAGVGACPAGTGIGAVAVEPVIALASLRAAVKAEISRNRGGG